MFILCAYISADCKCTDLGCPEVIGIPQHVLHRPDIIRRAVGFQRVFATPRASKHLPGKGAAWVSGRASAA